MSDERAYRVLVRFEKERELFTARVPELDVSGEGATRAEAIAKAEEALESRFQGLADGAKLPEPVDVLPAAPVLSLQLSAATHRDLAYLASQEGLTVEAFAQELIARGLGFREGANFGPRREAAPARPQQPQRAQGGGPRDADAQPDVDPAQRGDRDRGPPRRDDRGPRRGREGYRPDLDNQANFLEYARSLEKGGGGGGGGGGNTRGGGGGGGRGRGGR